MLHILLQPCADLSRDPTSPWHADDNWRMNAPAVHKLTFAALDKEWEVTAEVTGAGKYLMKIGEFACEVRHWHLRGYGFWALEEKQSGECCGLTGTGLCLAGNILSLERPRERGSLNRSANFKARGVDACLQFRRQVE